MFNLFNTNQNPSWRVPSFYINMFERLLLFLFEPANWVIFNTYEPLKNASDVLKGNQKTYSDLRGRAAEIKRQYTIRKKEIRSSLTSLTMVITRAVFAYAKSVNNTQLAQSVWVNKSELTRGKDEPYRNRIQALINIIEPLADQIESYVSPEELEQWKTAFSDYANYTAKPLDAIAFRKSLLNQANAIAQQNVTYCSEVMDGLAMHFAESNPQFYINYRNARKLIPAGNRHTKFRVTAVNENGSPVYNVRIIDLNSGQEVVTDLKGKASMYIIPEGIHSFRLISGSQSIETGPIEIKRGETVSRTYQIELTGYIIPEPVSETRVQHA